MSAKDRAFVKANLLVPLAIDLYFQQKGVPTPRWASDSQKKALEETGSLSSRDYLNANARRLRVECLELGKPEDLVNHFQRLVKLLDTMKALPGNRKANYELYKRVKSERDRIMRNNINLRRKYNLPSGYPSTETGDLSTEEKTL